MYSQQAAFFFNSFLESANKNNCNKQDTVHSKAQSRELFALSFYMIKNDFEPVTVCGVGQVMSSLWWRLYIIQHSDSCFCIPHLKTKTKKTASKPVKLF